MPWGRLLAALTALASLSVERASAQQFPTGFHEVEVVGGFSGPTAFAHLPDASVLVAEKRGRLSLVGVDGNVRHVLTVAVSLENERGLLGLAADPNFEQNAYIYIYYTTTEGSCPGPTCGGDSEEARAVYAGPRNRVSRFELRSAAVDPETEVVVLDGIPSDSGDHNGGDLAFGPDGWLYVTTGDAGANPALSQSWSTLAGKILRIAPDGTAPPANPLIRFGALPEIWAYGLRNPWRLAFDESGALLVGDVGASSYEEVNHVVAAGNYGWPVYEGVALTGMSATTATGVPPPATVRDAPIPPTMPAMPATPSPRPPLTASYRSPLLAYAHDDGGAAVILGAVPGADSPYPDAYRSQLFFADLIRQTIYVMDYDLARGTAEATAFATDIGLTSQVRRGPTGTVWFLSFSRGALFEIRYGANE